MDVCPIDPSHVRLVDPLMRRVINGYFTKLKQQLFFHGFPQIYGYLLRYCSSLKSFFSRRDFMMALSIKLFEQRM